MRGLRDHLEFQVRLAGGKGGGNSAGGGGGYDNSSAIYQSPGETPDSIPDIGSMVSIDSVG